MSDTSRTVKITSGGTADDDRPVTTVSAQTNTSVTKPKTTDADSAVVVAATSTATAPAPAAPAPAEAVTVSAQTVTSTSTPSATQPATGAEAGTTLAAASTGPSTAQAPPAAPAPAVPVQTPAAAPAPAVTAPAPAVTAPPNLRELVAHLMKVLATTAIEAVDAVVQLMAELRAVLNAPSSLGQGVSNRHASSALHPSDSIVVLLKETLHRASMPGAPSPAPNRARSAHGSVDATPATPVSVMLKSTVPVLANPQRPGPFGLPAPTEEAVTALVAMSIWALLYSALPGLSGLFAAGATGVRIGYRQAKARVTLHDMKFARFVRSGPIGVVRTGSPAVAPVSIASGDGARHLKIAS
ncbi:hypothetical protein LT350_31130 [Mycolicibacterium smegmatis]|uniref:hypothetical protein n=1 Tax=Mycolicibacterium smegmatis TaxID=1772 RepID=UPI001E362CD2|nr:hypothetical protein [Mycolicibacterium smegmatis]UGU30911.1 hypothetical protein LT350_31130 [Mycolicibacterium smegmatis]